MNFSEHVVKQHSLPGRRLAVAHYFRDHRAVAFSRSLFPTKLEFRSKAEPPHLAIGLA